MQIYNNQILFQQPTSSLAQAAEHTKGKNDIDKFVNRNPPLNLKQNVGKKEITDSTINATKVPVQQCIGTDSSNNGKVLSVGRVDRYNNLKELQKFLAFLSTLHQV